MPQSDLPIMIPYDELCRLLESAGKVESLISSLKLLESQQAALKNQFFELSECFDRLRDSVSD